MCQFFGLCLEIKQLTKYYMHYSISKMHVCMCYGWFVVVFSVRRVHFFFKLTVRNFSVAGVFQVSGEQPFIGMINRPTDRILFYFFCISLLLTKNVH